MVGVPQLSVARAPPLLLNQVLNAVKSVPPLTSQGALDEVASGLKTGATLSMRE